MFIICSFKLKGRTPDVDASSDTLAWVPGRYCCNKTSLCSADIKSSARLSEKKSEARLTPSQPKPSTGFTTKGNPNSSATTAAPAQLVRLEFGVGRPSWLNRRKQSHLSLAMATPMELAPSNCVHVSSTKELSRVRRP